MQTHGPDATHWNNGKPMTEREKRRRAGFLAHIAKQRAMQTGENPKFNIAVDGAEVIVVLDNVTDMPEN